MRKQLVAQRAAAAIAGGDDELGTPGTPATPGTPSAAAAPPPPPPLPPPAAPSRDPRMAGLTAADPRLAAADPRLRGSDPRLAAAGAEAGAAAGAAATPKRTAAAAGLEEGGGESEHKMQRTPSVLPDMSGDGAADSPDVEAHRAVSGGSNAPPPGRGKIKLTLASG
jgi:hypothetical protein